MFSWMLHIKSFQIVTIKSEFHNRKKPLPTARARLHLEVERKNSSDEHILIVLVTQSHCAASHP